MPTARINKVSIACPVFDGTEYPYWKNKMRMHLEAIDVDLWYVVKNGVPKTGEGVTPTDVKKFIQVDSTAKNIICGHLTKGPVFFAPSSTASREATMKMSSSHLIASPTSQMSFVLSAPLRLPSMKWSRHYCWKYALEAIIN